MAGLPARGKVKTKKKKQCSSDFFRLF